MKKVGKEGVITVEEGSGLENELDVMVSLQDASACATIGELVDKVEEEL